MNVFKQIAVTSVATLLLASLTVAAPGQKGKAKPAVCPVCHMALSAKKDKTHTVAVKVKGKTMYCCAGCNMKPKTATKTK